MPFCDSRIFGGRLGKIAGFCSGATMAAIKQSQPRLGHGTQSYDDRAVAEISCRAHVGSSCDVVPSLPLADQNSDSFHADPSSPIRIDSRKRPAVRLSISDFKRSASLSADSSHASHPHFGNAVIYQRPKRTRIPGKAEKTKTTGAASASLGTSVMLGRTDLQLPSNSGARPSPSARSASNSSSNWSSNSAATICKDANRSGFVTREEASGGEP